MSTTTQSNATKLTLAFTKEETRERVNNWWRVWMSGDDAFTLQAALSLTSAELAQYLAGDFTFKQD